jgi:hypothetical protein
MDPLEDFSGRHSMTQRYAAVPGCFVQIVMILGREMPD